MQHRDRLNYDNTIKRIVLIIYSRHFHPSCSHLPNPTKPSSGRFHQPQAPLLQLRRIPINDIGRKVRNIHRILRPHHVPRPDVLDDLLLLLGEVLVEQLQLLLGDLALALQQLHGLLVALQLLEHGLLVFGPGGVEGGGAEVDGLGELVLGDFVGGVGGALDDWKEVC